MKRRLTRLLSAADLKLPAGSSREWAHYLSSLFPPRLFSIGFSRN
jgi:hypothetical protein